MFDIAQNRSYKISQNNVARCIWENRVVDIGSDGLVILEFMPHDDAGVKFMDVLPYVIVAVLVIGGRVPALLCFGWTRGLQEEGWRWIRPYLHDAPP